MEMDITRFREESEKRKKTSAEKPLPYTAEQRFFAVGYAKDKMDKGESRISVGKALGISDATLLKWMQPHSGGLRRVRVSKEEGSTGGVTISIIMPDGIRVEVLGVESAIAILRGIG